MPKFDHLVSGAAWNIGGKVLQLVLSLAALAVVARVVGPAVYGIFALGWVVVGLFEVLVSAAPTDALVQRKALSAGHLNTTFWVSLAMSFLVVTAVWPCAELLDGWLGGGTLLAAILPFRAAVLPLQAMAAVPTAILIRESRFKALAGAEALASVTCNVAGVGMALSGMGIWSLVGMELVRALVLCCTVLSVARWKPGLRMGRSHLDDLLAFNASTWGSWGLGYLSSQLPRFLIATALGSQAVGFYALAQRLFDQVKNIVMVPAYQVVQAGIARAQDDENAALRITQGTLRITGVVACPLFFGLAAVAPTLIPTVFGSSWVPAVPVVQIMMLLGVLSSISVVQAAVIRGMGKPHWEILFELAVVAATAVLLVLALPLGMSAATAAVVVGNAVAEPLNAYFVRRLTRLSIRAQFAAVFQAGFASLFMAVSAWGVATLIASSIPALVSLAVTIVFGALVYWALLRWMMPAAAKVIQRVVVAAARGDVRAMRASLAGWGD